MATLSGGINATTDHLRVTGGTAEIGRPYRIDNEVIILRDFERYPFPWSPRDATRWDVTRGAEGSTAASHSNGATIYATNDAMTTGTTLTPPDPFPSSGGGSSFPSQWTVGDDGSLYIGVSEPFANPAIFEQGGYGLQIDNTGALILYPNLSQLGNGSQALVLVYSDQGTTPVFSIGADGSVHIRTGTSIVADL